MMMPRNTAGTVKQIISLASQKSIIFSRAKLMIPVLSPKISRRRAAPSDTSGGSLSMRKKKGPKRIAPPTPALIAISERVMATGKSQMSVSSIIFSSGWRGSLSFWFNLDVFLQRRGFISCFSKNFFK
mgnify:CR=1 FL=1